MVEISKLELIFFSLWIEGKDNKIEALTLTKGIYRFPIGLKWLELTMGLSNLI